MILRARNNLPSSEAMQGFFDKGGASFGHARGQFGSSLVWADLHFALKKNVTRVHSRVNAHGGKAGARLAVHDGPADGGSAAIFWKQGSVEVDPTARGNREKPRRDDLAVSDDHDDIGSELFQELLHFGSANFFGLMNRNVRSERDLLHGRNGNLLTTPARPVRLGDDGDNLEIRLGEQVLQRGNSELRSATED